MNRIITALISLTFALALHSAATAQFTIKIPKIKKVTKETPKSEATARSTEPARSTTPAKPETPVNKPPVATEPYLTLNSIMVKAFTTSGKSSVIWLPDMKFVVNGPVASGDRLRVDYNFPGIKNPIWCEPYTKPLNADQWLSTECDARSYDVGLGSTYTGPVNFTVKMFNELAGTDRTIFTGTFNVKKAKARGISKPGDFSYWVDYDWNLPISYIFLAQDSVYGERLTRLNLSYWTRGTDHIGAMDPHLFYQGKEIPSKYACDEKILIEPTLDVEDSVKPTPTWKRFNCEFYQIFGTNSSNGGVSGPTHSFDKNPGEYEFKLLRNGRLARSIKFTVKPGGSIDNGIASSNKVGTWWTIVPATVIGDQDGAYDKTAWKTGAFWGHPLTKGFVVN